MENQDKKHVIAMFSIVLVVLTVGAIVIDNPTGYATASGEIVVRGAFEEVPEDGISYVKLNINSNETIAIAEVLRSDEPIDCFVIDYWVEPEIEIVANSGFGSTWILSNYPDEISTELNYAIPYGCYVSEVESTYILESDAEDDVEEINFCAQDSDCICDSAPVFGDCVDNSCVCYETLEEVTSAIIDWQREDKDIFGIIKAFRLWVYYNLN